MAEEYGRLKVATIPSLPEQEAEAERLHLAGAATAEQPQQDTPFSVPIDTGDTDFVQADGGDSIQIPSAGMSSEGASSETHLHYWVHTVTETIDRGFTGFDSIAWNLPKGIPVQIFGLDDLRPRGEVTLLEVDDDTIVYVGNRDVLSGAAPSSCGVWLMTAGDRYPGGYRARNELWAVAVGGGATIGALAYKSEPTSDQLATQSKSSKGIH